jgi:6-phosphogluconolactonase
VDFVNYNDIKIFESPHALATALTNEFDVFCSKLTTQPAFIAISGGSTPQLWFQLLTLKISIRWDLIHLFWVDERLVPSDNPESNYGVAKSFLLDHIPIPEKNIHRIHGENDPLLEMNRYTEEISQFVPRHDTPFPQFDWIFLGIGEDGHVASVFPGVKIIPSKYEICGISHHSKSNQLRMSLMIPIINNAKRISFLVTGTKKAAVVAHIINQSDKSRRYPAAAVKSSQGIVEFYLDHSAARLMNSGIAPK